MAQEQLTPAGRVCPVMEPAAGKKEVQAPAAMRSMVGSLGHWITSVYCVLSTATEYCCVCLCACVYRWRRDAGRTAVPGRGSRL